MPSPEAFTIVLNSTIDGFFVILNTLQHSTINRLRRESSEGLYSSSMEHKKQNGVYKGCCPSSVLAKI